ncbi:RNA polymerase sigma-70 factor (ECF subfamily) [Prauserella shujinwangii]|uniref:RNA polymerase sigma-70 factor (ECF subfamily) n=1 Tax=Prauserella shujinwangii TaxID=1453103 RepID=A0A2T0LTL6_9PSEU|nr:sigma-70 family RNA polymerase sigma factor [Prauserella shujinwangii]PRX47082.1 RNA polymerase sigma-70 factor (ECF subfamily) [Prauserella shujinwangii]
MASTDEALAGLFAEHRTHLVGVAYRLTGSLADSEDAVQEAWLRLAGLPAADRERIRDVRAWLTTVVGRICLDRLRSAAVRRERYVGEWLPEPIVTPADGAPGEDPLDAVVRDDGVRMAAMVVLERLTPEQRVAFVLHDAFAVPFGEIAATLGCSAAAARQHASRGRRAVADADPPPRADLAAQREVLERFAAAVLSGDVRAVAEALHPDVVLIGDSDGKGRTARRVIAGADKLVRFFQGLLRTYRPGAFATARPVLVNGDLGLYVPAAPGGDGYRDLDTHVQTLALRDGRVVAVYDVVNPDKLTRLPASVVSEKRG